jgi:hypothetical protein
VTKNVELETRNQVMATLKYAVLVLMRKSGGYVKRFSMVLSNR